MTYLLIPNVFNTFQESLVAQRVRPWRNYGCHVVDPGSNSVDLKKAICLKTLCVHHNQIG